MVLGLLAVADRCSGLADIIVRPRKCYSMRPAVWNPADPLITANSQESSVTVELSNSFSSFLSCIARSSTWTLRYPFLQLSVSDLKSTYLTSYTRDMQKRWTWQALTLFHLLINLSTASPPVHAALSKTISVLQNTQEPSPYH